MSKVMLVFEDPMVCGDCPFVTAFEDLYVGNGLYKKVSRCRYAPNDIEDPWRDVQWQYKNKESWCPLKPYEKE